MITAQQVSQGMALQQQQHAMLTAGASGMMQAQPAMGMSQYPPQFSYAQAGNPSAGAPAMGGAAVMGGMAGGINAVSSVANYVAMPSMVAGMGQLGLAGAGVLGFSSPALAGGLATVAGGLPAGLLGAAGLGFAGATASAMSSGMRQTNQVNQMFGGMQFANMGGDPGTGRGFSQNSLGAIQRGIGAIDANNPFISMSDAVRATERFTDMGMHQGVQDAERMAKKITEMGKTMHQMARIMGTSMEEAGQAMGSMRSSGFYSASDVMGNTTSMNVMRGYGMTSDRFSGMQASGASATRSAQMSGRAGAGFVTSSAMDIMGGIRAGTISGEQIMDITGGRDPLEAAQIMAQQSLGATMQGFSGSGGRSILAAIGTMKDGKYTGGVDANLMRKGATGQLTYHDTTRIGAGKIGSGRGAQLSFEANQQDIMDSALQNPEASNMLLGILRSQAKEMKDESDEMVQQLAKTQFNMDRRQFRILSRMAEQRKEGHRARLAEIKRDEDASSRAADIRENRSLGGALQKVTGGAADIWQQGAVKPWADFSRDVVEGFQDLERWHYGTTNMEVSSSAIRSVVMDGTATAPALSSSPMAAARQALSTGRMSEFVGSLGAVDTEGINLAGIDKGAQVAMSSSRGTLMQRKVTGTSDRMDKLEALRAQVRSQKSGLSADQVDAVISKSGDAGARLVAQERARTNVLQDIGGAILGRKGADTTNQDHLAAVSGLDDEMFTGEKARGLVGMNVGGAMIALGVAGAVLATGGLGLLPALALGGAAVAAGVATGAWGINARFGDSDLDDMREELTSGKSGTELVAAYTDPAMQTKIDAIISSSEAAAGTKEKGRAAAAKKLSRLLMRPVTERDVEIADTVMAKRTGKNAAERKAGLSKKEREAVSQVAGAAGVTVSGEAAKRVLGGLQGLGSELSGMGLGAAADKLSSSSSLRDSYTQLAGALESGVSSGLAIADDASGSQQIFGMGMETLGDLQRAGEGGLTLTEMATATNFSEADIRKIMEAEGITATNGSVTNAADMKKISGALAARVVGATLAGGEEGIQRAINAGMSNEERVSQSLADSAVSHAKSREMLEALSKKVGLEAEAATLPVVD